MAIRPTLTAGFQHLEAGHPDNPKPWTICGGRTRQTESNVVCTLPAGWGTSHPGAGRCKLHGGSNMSGPGNGMFKHGRYAHAFRGRLAEHYQNIGAAEENPLDLIPELLVQRTMLALAIDRLQAGAPIQPSSEANGSDNVIYQKHTNPVAIDTTPNDSDLPMSARDPITSPSSAPFTSHSEQGDMGGDSLHAGTVIITSLDGRSRKRRGKDKGEAELIEGMKERVEAKIQSKILVDEEDLRLVLEYTNAIVGTVGKMEAIRNQSALTKAEVVYLMAMLKEVIGEFIPEAGRRKEFIQKLMERLPVLGGEGGGE